jgi:hypothetical protein
MIVDPVEIGRAIPVTISAAARVQAESEGPVLRRDGEREQQRGH